MCFSAPVSFITSGGIGALSVAVLRRAKRGLRWVAIIPLFFAVQQFAEGVLWVVDIPGTIATVMGYVFLSFAFVVWPTYIPWMLLRNETQSRRRWWLRVLMGAGAVISVYLLTALVRYPLEITIVGRSIHYGIDVPMSIAITALYVIVVLSSFFISSIQFMRWFGAALLVSAGLAATIFTATFVSVWCFFAAALSVALLLHVRKARL